MLCTDIGFIAIYLRYESSKKPDRPIFLSNTVAICTISVSKKCTPLVSSTIYKHYYNSRFEISQLNLTTISD